MPWLQFLTHDDQVMKEYKVSQQAQVGITPDGGVMVQDPAGQDTEDNPRILLVKGEVPWKYAKTISDQVHDGIVPGEGVILGKQKLTTKE